MPQALHAVGYSLLCGGIAEASSSIILKMLFMVALRNTAAFAA